MDGSSSTGSDSTDRVFLDKRTTLLEEGRTSMINRTRYGPSNTKTESDVIRARLFWIAQSVVLTTIGSGLGTWLGFKLGLRSMENSLSSLPGSRQRVMEAFNQAHDPLNLILQHGKRFENKTHQNNRPNSSPPSNRTSSSSSSSSSSVIGNRASTTLESPNSNLSQSQDEFEKLLERERNLSAGITHPSDRYPPQKLESASSFITANN
ncbi:hypothetical protein KEM48_011457 [Puccinia striiformis f. sp. tritici PST-130]|nr:hypothetical protein KEM48_011457 [Puccinia striiformis f. sp. tritici PST-130]